MPPISSNTGSWDSGLAADSRWSRTRSYRDWTCRGDSVPFSGRKECLPKQRRRPPHSSWASCSEPPAPMHNTNATADLSTCNGTPTTFGQHNDCQERDDTERTRPDTTPSVPPSHDLRPPFFPLEHAYAAYDASLTYISDDVVRFWHPPSVLSQWTLSPFTVDVVEYNCAEQFMMASKARLFRDDTALSAILASDDPREQKRLGRQVRHFDRELWQSECENIVFHGNLAKFSQNEKCAWPSCTPCPHRLAEASSRDKLWGIDLSACDPESTNASTVMCATLATTSCKKIANISSREATLRHSHTNMRYALPLDILANAASPKLAP